MILYSPFNPPWPALLPLGSCWGQFGAKGSVLGPIFASSWPSLWKEKASESSESPTTTILQPQALILHATLALRILIWYCIHWSHLLAWSFYQVSFVSGGRSNEGAIWCRHQKQDVGHSFLDKLWRDATIPHFSARGIYTWAQRRLISATEVMHGPRKSIRTNFRMGGVMGVVTTLGHISRCRHALTHRYHPKLPSSNIQEGI